MLINISQDNYPYINSGLAQDKIAQIFKKYKEYVMPVVNEKHQIIGKITIDDILDISYEEADKDLAVISGTAETEIGEDNFSKNIAFRLVWLLLTLVFATTNSVFIERLNIDANILLVTFIPIIMAMSGNAGIQSSSIFIRRIALGKMKDQKLSVLISKELLSGITLGFFCACFASLFIRLGINIFNINLGIFHPFTIQKIIFFSVFITMTFSSIFGALFPILLQRFNIDPAIAAGPLVTTLNDIFSSIVYFSLAYNFFIE